MRSVYEIIEEKTKRKRKQKQKETVENKNKSNKLLVFKKYTKREIRNQRKQIVLLFLFW